MGRFVGKEGIMKFRGYTRPMLVTGYSGSRLYVRTSMADRNDDDGNPTMPPVEEWDEEFPIQIKTVAYVCDTKEEGELVMAASRNSLRIWQEGEKRVTSLGPEGPSFRS